jgi:hypothetical protein
MSCAHPFSQSQTNGENFPAGSKLDYKTNNEYPASIHVTTSWGTELILTPEYRLMPYKGFI